MTLPMQKLESSTTSTASPPAKNPSRRIRCVSDGLEYPNLYATAYLEGPAGDCRGFATWLGRAGVSRAETPAGADFVVFTGGSDVSPTLYNQSRLPGTYTDAERDEVCMKLYEHCRKERIPMLGICRGAQFLWVAQGGQLWQDLDNHDDGEHQVMYLPTQQKLRASSVHHQACKIGSADGMRVLMTSTVSTRREDDTAVRHGTSTDLEAYSFKKSGILGIQGHPEYAGYEEYSYVCAKMVREHLIDYAPLAGGFHRLPV